jgi:prophage antirepressor-like protein
VLPSIRKHGGYAVPNTVEELLLNPDTLIRLAGELKKERQARIAAEESLWKEQTARITAEDCAAKEIIARNTAEKRARVAALRVAQIESRLGLPDTEDLTAAAAR